MNIGMWKWSDTLVRETRTTAGGKCGNAVNVEM